MAEGFARHWGQSWIDAQSAGVAAAGFISPLAVAAMQETGIDISLQKSKSIKEIELASLDYLVTLEVSLIGAEFPVGKQTEIINWIIPDPMGGSIEVYRRVRDMLKARIKNFVEQIRPE